MSPCGHVPTCHSMVLGWDRWTVGLLSHPSLFPQYLELLRSHQNRPAKCLTILWALGQAGFTDLAEGLRGESSCALMGSCLPGVAPMNCSSIVCCVCVLAVYVKHELPQPSGRERVYRCVNTQSYSVSAL